METQSSELIPITPRPIKSENLTVDLTEGLTKKQSKFVDNYLDGDSPYRAAIRAGYSPFTAEAATKIILNNPKVSDAIARRSIEVFKQKKIDRDFVINKAVELADSNILDYLEIDEKGVAKVDLRRINRAMGAAIQELSYDPEGRLRIRLVDKKASVELLARICKLFSDSDNHSSGGGEVPLTIQAIDKIVQNVQVNMIQQPKERYQLPDVISDSQ